jgi:hypothetical protein
MWGTDATRFYTEEGWHLAENRNSSENRGQAARLETRRNETNERLLLTSRFREGSTIDEGAAILIFPSRV